MKRKKLFDELFILDCLRMDPSNEKCPRVRKYVDEKMTN
jgi:hypothetical protein